MDGSWFVQPETCRLLLSDGQWIQVKRRLTAGEYRAHLRRASRVGDDGIRRVDGFEHGLSLVVSYLVDWSLPDIAIRKVSEADLVAALDNLDQDRFAEIRSAIAAHEAAIDAERDAAKKKTVTTSGDAPISESPSVADGVLIGSGS